MNAVRSTFALTTLFVLAMAGAAHAQEIGKGLVVILVGAPESGKSTQAAFIQKRYRIPVIAIEDLIKENPSAFKNRQPSGAPNLDLRMEPAIIGLFKKKLESIDARRGFVSDGFPASREQADALAAMVMEKRLSNPVVIQISVPDEELRARAEKNPNADLTLLALRIEDYHREIGMLRSYYPQANIWEINGARTPKEVSDTIEVILKDPEFDPPK
jgi:adenylate kinase family enzyme